MAHYRENIRSKRKAQEVMERKGSRTYRDFPGTLAVRMGYATYLVETNQGLAIRQHGTNIVVYLDGMDAVMLTTGGWNTVSTLERLQTFTPSVISVRGRNIHSKSSARLPLILAEYREVEYDLSDGENHIIELRPEHVIYE